eukprot:CAMPEP_0172410434 /NCGR_PEP_ID=MMETSP1061-20121228/76882_1 /TAXON_ID=37318 /ORGANISM="Pseudo-nitzschia pungens, Strain cf. pungens" /LENGTH=814 /DNA_ID=CAMNT_0013146619 /DNA_START=87 /DNA_END=2531 /DNA_ORIENTATION=-
MTGVSTRIAGIVGRKTSSSASSSGSSFLLASLLTRFVLLLSLFFLQVHARRRNPLSEATFSEFATGGESRRLTESIDSNPESKSNSNSNANANANADSKWNAKSNANANARSNPQSEIDADFPHRNLRSLIGTNVNVPKASNPDDHLVTNLPLLSDFNGGSKHWAGLLPVNDKGDGYLFYWLFAPDAEQLEAAKADGRVNQDESNVPLLIWLNGGPACSSMDGLWLENGPFRLDPGNGANGNNWNDIRIDPHSWHNAPAYVLYIDQPVGTGLAFTTSGNYPNNDERVNEDFYYFLTEFMKLHGPNLNVRSRTHEDDRGKIENLATLQRPFYFSGESHAGHYIPSMMNYIRKKNANPRALQESDGVAMPLSGALIGNGWFDPIYQYSAHEAAYGYGLIGKAQERSLAIKEESCRADLRNGHYTSGTCFNLLDEVVTNSLGRDNPFKVSQYDQRKWENRNRERDFPPGHKDVEAFLGKAQTIANAPIQSVLEAIHASPSWEAGQRYRECTDPPYEALSHQDGLGVVQDIVELLENDGDGGDGDDGDETSGEGNPNPTRLLFFNGVQDLICNHAGNENALENLPWKHRFEYVTSQRYGWKAPSIDKLGGYMKEFRNLSFLKVIDSGHMVPMDVPGVALDMLRTFVYGESFRTYQQKLSSNGEIVSHGCPACPSSGETCPECLAFTKENCVVTWGNSLSTKTKSAEQTNAESESGVGWGLVVLLALAAVKSVEFVRGRRSGSGGSDGVELANVGYSDLHAAAADDDNDNDNDDNDDDNDNSAEYEQRIAQGSDDAVSASIGTSGDDSSFVRRRGAGLT